MTVSAPSQMVNGVADDWSDAIPATLRSLPQWLCWHYGPPRKSEKPPKVPVSPRTGQNADVNDHRNWGTFGEAVEYWQRCQRRIVGIGFVLTLQAGIVGIDLDGCRDPGTGALEPWAAQIVADLSTYCGSVAIRHRRQAVRPTGVCRREADAGSRVEMYERWQPVLRTITSANAWTAPL